MFNTEEPDILEYFTAVLVLIAFLYVSTFGLGKIYNLGRLNHIGEFRNCVIVDCDTTKRIQPEKPENHNIIYHIFFFDCTTKPLKTPYIECQRMRGNSCILFVSEKLGNPIMVSRKSRLLALWKGAGFGGILVLIFVMVFLIVLLRCGYILLSKEIKRARDEFQNENDVTTEIKLKRTSEIILLTTVVLMIILTPLLVNKFAVSFEGENTHLNGVLFLLIIISVCFGPFTICYLYNEFKSNRTSIVKIVRNIVGILLSLKILYSVILLFFKKEGINSLWELLIEFIKLLVKV